MKKIILLLFLSVFNLKAIVVWEKLQPSCGESLIEVNCMKIQDSVLYLGVNGKGIYKNSLTERNSEWLQFPIQIKPSSIDEIFFDSTGSIYVSIGKGNKVAYKSINNPNWKEIYNKTSLSSQSFPVLTSNGKLFVADSVFVTEYVFESGFFNPYNRYQVPGEIIGFRIDRDYKYIFTNGTLYKYGKDSVEMPFPFSQLDYSMVYENGDIYAGVKKKGLFRLQSDSLKWDTVKYAGNDTFVLDYFNRIKEGPGGEIFVCSTRGLFASFDGGKEWNNICNLTSRCNIRDMAFIDGKIIISDYYDGIYESSDLGQSWNEKLLNRNIDTIHKVWCDRFNNIYVSGNNNNLFRSQDGAKTFSNVFIGLPKGEILSFIDLPDSSILISVKDDGMYMKSNLSDVWSKSSNGISYDVNQLLLLNDEYILAATKGDGIYRSSDLGQSWRKAKIDTAFTQINCFARDYDNNIIAYAEHWGLLKSTDNGFLWTLAERDTSVSGIFKMLFSKYYLFAVAPEGMFRRNNSLWEQINCDNTKIHPTDMMRIKNKIYVSSPEKGINNLLDDNGNWEFHNGNFEGPVTSLASDSSLVMYAATMGDGLHRTTAPVLSIENEELCENKLYLEKLSDNLYSVSLKNTVKMINNLKLINLLGNDINLSVSPLDNNAFCISTEKLAKGVYLLIVQAGNEVYSCKLIVN